MTSKILRANGTEITGVKSCVFQEVVNAGNGLRPGCVASASIDVEVYGAQSSAPTSGEALTYYQVDSEENETLIGVFYAEPSIPSRNTYTFTAYDAVSKLDVSFSERLNNIQSSFPMTIYNLVSEACSVAGVTLGSASWPLSTQTVQAFYADGLTCRNILQYAAELAGRFVRCGANGNVVFDWYTTNSTYSIHPGASQSGYIAYKQDGLTYDNYAVLTVDAVAIRPSGTEGAAYIYPNSYSSVVATDLNGDGNVILTNITATDDNNGNLYLGVNATEDGSANVTVSNLASASNTLILSDNLLLTNASAETYNAAAQNIYNIMSALPVYRHATIQLFPNENPFRAGEFVSVTDVQGVSFYTPVFAMTIESAFAKLSSSGSKTYDADSSSVDKVLKNLASNLVQLDRLKVNWADIQTAIVQYLKLYGLMSVYEDNTLTTEGGKIGYATGSNSFGGGIAIQHLGDGDGGIDSDYNGSVVVTGDTALFLGSGSGIYVDGGVDVTQENFTQYILMNAADITENDPTIEITAGGLDGSLNNGQPSIVLGIGNYNGQNERNHRPENTFNGYNDFEHITAPEIGTLSSLSTTAKASLVAAINELVNKTYIRTYSSVTQLGLTSGDATIAGALSAMANNSIGFFPVGDFVSDSTPSTFGVVRIIRGENSARSSIEFLGKTDGYGDYRMYLDGTTNQPTGTWLRNGHPYVQAVDVTIPAGSTSTTANAPTVQGRTFLCWCAVATIGWVGAAYCASADASSTNVFTSSGTWTSDRLVRCTALYI